MAQQYFYDPAHSLIDKLHNVLARSPYFAGRNVRATVQENEVVLNGVVSTYYQKQIAQETILAIDGVEQIRNEIEVISV